MSDLAAAERQWHDWIVRACEAVGVDPDLVDVAGVHELTGDIAHGFSRPMAPVGAFIWGLALGQARSAPEGEVTAAGRDGLDGVPVDPEVLRRAIAATAEQAASRS